MLLRNAVSTHCEMHISKRAAVEIPNMPQREEPDGRIHENHKDFIDAPLAEKGIAQCEAGGEGKRADGSIYRAHLPRLRELKIVFVSPLRRAMQTAAIVLAEHRYKSEIAVCIDPWMTDVFSWVSSIPQPLKETKAEATKLFKGFKSIDFSALDALASKADEEDLWLMQMLPAKDRLAYQELKENKQAFDFSSVQETMLEFLIMTKYAEPVANFKMRMEKHK